MEFVKVVVNMNGENPEIVLIKNDYKFLHINLTNLANMVQYILITVIDTLRRIHCDFIIPEHEFDNENKDEDRTVWINDNKDDEYSLQECDDNFWLRKYMIDKYIAKDYKDLNIKIHYNIIENIAV